MSEPTPPQGVVQSVGAPQQQQQQQQQQQGTPQQQNATPASSVPSDQLVCQWSNCGERCPSAEQLYDHVCERHVGRKSTNNLNLTCQWGNCRTTTVKRDHITSHIRVHVPLKPHKCDFCGKAFKRPQDLKKHVKTHADDSVLLRSPEPNRGPHGGGGGYQGPAGKLVADLQALAATASGYYPDNGMGQNGGYGQQHPGGPPGGFYGGPPQNSAYGPVYYAVNQAQQMNNDSYEIRKRAAYDALNEFFGDAKRRAIDPTTYYDVGQRLMGLQGVQLPVIGGYQGGMSEYGNGGTMVAHPTHPPAMNQHAYSLPALPNLRTKNDLLNIDQFLEQLQSTVYENANPNHAAAAGVAQPGTHYVHPGVNYRPSHSPPGTTNAHPQSSHATAMASMTAPSGNDTPALTPASSVYSHNSPSGHSAATVSPTSRNPGLGSMYPTLPSVSTMDNMSYPATSGAPPSALAPSFDADGRRRYSSNLLQAPAPDRRDINRVDPSDESGSPKDSRRNSEQDALRHDVDQLAIQSPKVDPTLSMESPSQRSAHSPEHAPEQVSWVENARTIEKLRQFIKDKLDHHDYDSDDEESKDQRNSLSDDAQNLYPVLRAVQEGRE